MAVCGVSCNEVGGAYATTHSDSIRHSAPVPMPG